MISVSSDFKNAMKQPVKELSSYIILQDDSRITSSDDLISFKITGEGGLCKTVMRKCEIKFLGEHNLLSTSVDLVMGVKLPNNTYEYINYGSFLITETTTTKDTGVTTVVGYDNMIKTYQKYFNISQYPITLFDFANEVCETCDIELGNTTLVNGSLTIDNDLYTNIKGVTYRDIIQQIAEASGSIAMIGTDNKLYFKYIYNTGEQITYANMLKLKLEPLYGEINSVILSRQPQEDNIVLQDGASIEEYGITDFKISNNEIVDKKREIAITPIFNILDHIKYYPFETETEGLGWYEIGDNITIVNDTGTLFNTTIFNISLTMDGSLKEKLSTKAVTKTETDYSRAGGIDNRIKNTEIEVNKQENEIRLLNSDMYDSDGIINHNFTELYSDIENIINTVQKSGGVNLIKNSVMFAYDTNNLPIDWEVSGAGTLNIHSSSEAMVNGSVSGNVFELNNKMVKQRISVKQDTSSIPIDEKNYYTFSTKVKKDSTGTGYIKIFNENEEYLISFENGEAPFYGDYEIKSLLPTTNYYDIEFYGSADSNITFTDNMFALGEYKTQWQQATGEIMNTQVNINVNGVLVRSTVYLGDYTIMSPLEFAGYSMVNNTLTRVFTLNKDTTEMTKIKVTSSFTMVPLKLVPIITGDVLGWAFVPVTL